MSGFVHHHPVLVPELGHVFAAVVLCLHFRITGQDLRNALLPAESPFKPSINRTPGHTLRTMWSLNITHLLIRYVIRALMITDESFSCCSGEKRSRKTEFNRRATTRNSGRNVTLHTYHTFVHHQDGNFSVGRPLDLLPHDGVNLHHLVREAMVVQEGSHFTAKRTGFILIQRQLQIPSLISCLENKALRFGTNQHDLHLMQIRYNSNPSTIG